MVNVLVADNDISSIAVIKKYLEDSDFKVTAVFDAFGVLEKLKHFKYDVLITDFNMPDMNGVELTEEVMKLENDLVVILVTAFSSIRSIVEALRKGGFDYLSKPIDKDELLLAISRGLERVSLINENRLLKHELEKSESGFIGYETNSEVIRSLLNEASKAAKTDSPILISGENGTGKKVFARFIHNQSSRKHKQFIVLNCSTNSPLVVESELFGHVKGTFNGAEKEHKGYLELASNGTIFLDEIENLDSMTQVKILRVLQDKEFSRVGDTKILVSNVRIIASTNKDLTNDIKAGKFSEDLYRRLKAFEFNLPPLRERKEDILFYFSMYLDYFCKKNNHNLMAISEDVKRLLMKYDWKGNINEVKKLAERISLIADNGVISSDLLPTYMNKPLLGGKIDSSCNFNAAKQEIIKQFEIEFISKYLKKNNGNVSATAKEINFHEVSLRQKISKLGINPHKFKTNSN